MNTAVKESVTVEQAVARMINFDYVPTKSSLLELLAAFAEEAEVELENATTTNYGSDEIEEMEVRARACVARLRMADALTDELNIEVQNIQLGRGSTLCLGQDLRDPPLLLCESVAEWALLNYGMVIPEWTAAGDGLSNANWGGITLKLLSGNRISCSHPSGETLTKNLADLNLLDKKQNTPNHNCAILIGLASGSIFPPKAGSNAKSADKKAISQIRSALKAFTGIQDDPFEAFDPHNGWKPKFTIKDRRKAADERAKEKAIHISHEQLPDYDEEDDLAAAFLREQEQDSGDIDY